MSKRAVGAAAVVLLSAGVVVAQAAPTLSTPSPADPAPVNAAKSGAKKTSAKPEAAKTPPTKSQLAAPEAVVTVTGKTSGFRSAIDRRSYSVANDLQKVGGSVADLLRNIPSVDVDVQGNVSLRGSSSVTILIDGRPSVLMQGQNRADVLQQLPADSIERVEVMTNPSAAFTPEGTGGIINLITRKTKKNDPKLSGSLRATLGTEGRYNGGISETLTMKNLSLTGGLNYRRSTSRADSTASLQELDPASGAFTPIRTTSSGKFVYNSVNASAGVDYDIDDQTRLSGQFAYYDFRNHGTSAGTYQSAALTGPLAQDYNTFGGFTSASSFTTGSATYLKKLGGEDHEVSVVLDLEQFDTRNASNDTYAYARPTIPNLYQNIGSQDSSLNTDLKVEYKGPLPGDAKLVTGYELDHDSDNREGRLGTSAADALVSPSLTNLFKYDQAVHALYATYQKPFGPLTILPGLRFEEVVIDTDQATSGQKNSQSYFDVYPTLHLSYKLDDDRTLTASYSRRVQRPNSSSLNPYRVYNGPLSYSEGNPELKPQITDSYELGYEFRRKQTYVLATLYYRDNRKQVTDITQELGGGVLLNTSANLGHSRNTGLELVDNGEVSKTLTYTFTGNLYLSQIDTAGLALTSNRSATVASVRANLNWSPTKKDFFQFTASARGKSLTAQGAYLPSATINLGYRHKVDDKLAIVFTAQDPFDMSRFRYTIDTPQLKEASNSSYHRRGFYLGFTYALGTGKAKVSEGFDFNSGSSGR